MKLIWCSVLIALFSVVDIFPVYAGAISDAIQEMCPEQSARYSSVVADEAIRMRDYVETYGCGVVSAYGVFMNTDENRVAAWESDEPSFEMVNQVFLTADRYQLNIQNNPIIFDALSALFVSDNSDQLDQLDNLLAYMSSRERRILNRNPERILYMIWAMTIDGAQNARDTLHVADRLERNFSIEKLPVSLIMDSQIAMVYPKFSPKKRLSLIQSVFHSYGSEFMMKIITNKQALPDLIYLLPPQSGDIKNTQGLTNDDLHRLQRDYVQIMKEIIISFNHLIGSFATSVNATAVLAPYIQDALRSTDGMSITSYLKAQIHSPIFQQYIRQNSCNRDRFADLVAIFFTFLAPIDKKSKEPITYLQHNLARIASWYHTDPSMRAWIIDTENEPDIFIRNLAWLPYFYEKISPRSKPYLSKLLSELSGSKNTNASFVFALLQNTDYFFWVSKATDADTTVVANEDVGDESAPKYRYILTTPFPGQNDRSIFEKFFKGKGGISAIHQLQNITVADLSAHEFTRMEKLMSALGNADNVITIVAIVAVPLTGGASIAVIGVRMAAKQAAKKGVKYAMKVGYRYVRKTAARNLRRVGTRLIGKEGKQVAWREVKELAGHTLKRGRPSSYAKGQKAMIKVISKTENELGAVQFGVVASGIATAIYCKKFATSQSNPLIQSLCRIEPVQEIQQNVCKKFK